MIISCCFNSDNNNNCIHRHNSRFVVISLRCELFPTRMLKRPGRSRVKITCSSSSACRVQHIMLRATWYKGTAQLLSLTEVESHLFQLHFIG